MGTLDRLIDEEMHGAGLAITADARALLRSLIGGDRAATRSEVRKLALYAHGKTTVDRGDVVAIVSDATTPALDEVVDAAFAGKPADLEIAFAKARASGIAAAAIAGAVIRQAATLHRLRMAVDAGSSIDSAMRSFFVHFSREAAIRAALTVWNARQLERLLTQFGDVSLQVRKSTKAGYLVVQRALVLIARTAQRRE